VRTYWLFIGISAHCHIGILEFMTEKEQIAQILGTLLEDNKFFIVDLQVSPSKSNHKVIVLVDSDLGISIDECAKISRQLDDEIFKLDLIPEAFRLEVSSPGVDYPLKFARQYIKNIGRTLKVIATDGSEKLGELIEATQEGFTIKSKPKKKSELPIETKMLYSEVSKSQIQISFS
jgi:ribosome maturation factor RimP